MTATTSEHRSAMQAAYASAALGNISFPVGTLWPWQIAALEKLSALHDLRPNWDSYGSPPISDDVLAIAKRLVGGAGTDAPVPRATAVSGGGVQLEWESGEKVIIVLVRSDQSIEVLVDNGSEEPAVETTLPSLNPAVLGKVLSWLSD